MTNCHRNTQSRRLLPPISALAAFEVAARTLSFTKSASELSLTQSAISRQIALLEQTLGTQVFEREGNKLTLTPAGRFYAERVRDALTALNNATAETIAFKGMGGILRLGILPTFGTRWLIPRMDAFFDEHPDITVTFTTHMPGPFDFIRENIDAAVHFGDPVWPGCVIERLMGEEMILVVAPVLAKKLNMRRTADVPSATLLVHASQKSVWSQWFEMYGLPNYGSQPQLTFALFGMILQAAIGGMGVALLPTMLIKDELASKQLIEIPNSRFHTDHCYYFVYPETKKDHQPIITFKNWLMRRIRKDRSTPTSGAPIG